MRIDTRSRGKRQSFDATGETVGQAFASVAPDGRAIVSLSGGDGRGGGGGRLVQAQRGRRGTWRIRTVDLGAQQSKSSRSGHVDQATAQQALTAYVNGDPEWQAATKLTVGLSSRSPALLIPATLAIATAGALGVMAATGNLEGFEAKYVPNLVVGVALISAIGVYADLFFRLVRPRLAAVVGARLGVRVVESRRYGWFSRPGFWETEGGGTISTLKANAADFVIIVFGLVVPIAAFATVVVLVADRFLA